MKKAVAISLAIFLIVVLAILVFGLAPNQNETNKTTPAPIPQEQTKAENNVLNNPQPEKIPEQQANKKQNTAPTGKGFSPSEVAKHNSISDCWLIINGKVYNVSKYLALDLHPGGSDTITPYCGKDATKAFETKDRARPKPHSQTAQNMLDAYYAGNLIQ